MTEDYKKGILKYLTGNINDGINDNTPIFDEEIETLNSNIVRDIKDKLTASDNANAVFCLGNLYNEIYEEYLVYGYYQDTSSNYYGFIYLVDGELNEIQMITTFASGTKLFPITALNQDENNNIYGLTYTIGSSSGTSKVLLFNNIFASGLLDGTYKAILRNDYKVPYNYNQMPYRYNRIVKSPESATYYITLTQSSVLQVIKFVINVGASNEWSVTSLPIGSYSRFDIKLNKNGDNEEYYIYALDESSPTKYYECKVYNGSATTVKTINLPSSASFVSQVYVKNINSIYIYAQLTDEYEGKIYKINGNDLKEIYSFFVGTVGSVQYYSTINLFQINNGMFFFKNKAENGTDHKVSVGYIKPDDTYVEYNVGDYSGRIPIANSVYYYTDFYYKSNYNLVNLFVPMYNTPNTTIRLTFDYNGNNYNGTPFDNKNMINSQKGKLFDNNNKIIFARNLYNKTVNNNITVSTLNVPNTLLNNTTIAKEDLIGETNYILIDNEENIEKNIYENVNINFHNTLKMVNENDPNNIIFNQIGSNRLNISSSNTIDYDNAKASKIRINYVDETTKIINIQFLPVSNYYYTNFAIYVDKEIKSIDFISDDEVTIYNTINPTLETNKTYIINQKVTIDDIIPTEELLYNNEEINYMNNKVYC